MNHSNFKRVGDRSDNMERQLKDEESAATKRKEQLKQHEESVKDTKSRLPTIRSELDEAVEDFNEARKKDSDGNAENNGNGDGHQCRDGARCGSNGARAHRLDDAPLFRLLLNRPGSRGGDHSTLQGIGGGVGHL